MCTPSSPFSELLRAWPCALWSSDSPCRPCLFAALWIAHEKVVRTSYLSFQPSRFFCKKKDLIPQLLPSIFSYNENIEFYERFGTNQNLRKFHWVWIIWFGSSLNGIRGVTLQFNNQWMNLLFGWDIIAFTNLPMLCFRQFSSCCWGSLRGRPWHLTPTLGLVVTLSATCFPVLSRRTCQTLRRVTLVAIVAITNPLIQNFAGFDICHFFKRVGWRRVVEDDDIGIRLPKCPSSVLSTFPIDPKKCILVHIPVSSRKYLSFMGTTVQNTVYRPSFTSFLPAIRPDWSMGLQETEEPTCWMCSSKRTGLVHCPAMINQLDFFHGSVGKHANTEYFRLNPNTSLLVASSLLIIQTMPASCTFLIRRLRDKACITPFTPSSSKTIITWWNYCHLVWKVSAMVVINGKYIFPLSFFDRQNRRQKMKTIEVVLFFVLTQVVNILADDHPRLNPFFLQRIDLDFISITVTTFCDHEFQDRTSFGVASNKSFQLASFVTPRVRIFSTKTCWTVSCSFSCKTSVVENSDDWKSSHQSFPGRDDSRLYTYPPMELATPNFAPLTQQVSPCIVDNELRLVEEVPGANPRWLRRCWADWQG